MDKLINKKENDKIVSFVSGKKVVHINTDEIMYLKAQGNYVAVYGEDGNELARFRGVLSRTYEQLEELGFITMHRSYIVNYKFIERLERKKIILKNGMEIKNSRSDEVFNKARLLYAKFVNEKK